MKRRRPRRPGPFYAVAAVVLGTLAAGVSPAAPRGGDLVADDGRSLWRLDTDGVLARVELADGRVERFPGSLPLLSALAGPVEGRLYALSVRPTEKGTSLLAIPTSSPEVEARWEVRGEGRFLEVTPDGSTACVLSARGEAWSLSVVGLLQPGAAPLVVALPFTPQAVTLMPDAESPLGFRLVVASTGRLATFQLSPPAPSWFYKSPGEHRAVRPLASNRALVALRDDAVAVFDPALRPREEGRVRLTDDDATGVVALPAAGEDLAVVSNAASSEAVVAVLHQGGTELSWVDTAEGRVMATRPLDRTRRMVARDGSLLLVGEADPAGLAPVETLTVPEVPEPRTPPTEPVKIVDRPKEAAAAPQPEPRKPPEPAKPSEEPGEAAAAPPPEPRKPPEQVRPAETPLQEVPKPSPPPEPAPPSAAAAPSTLADPRPTSLPFLSGRVNGNLLGAAEVRIYGPGNILKLHARVPLDRDGSFRLPAPPPGSYRVLISPESGVHLFTRPEYRTIVVAPGGGGLEGIDFEVRGAL